MHKYSYPYLGKLGFSSGAFILLEDVTRLWVKVTCGKFNSMGVIWKGTHVLIKGPTADNAYQSKNQALRSEEQSVELRNRFYWSHTSGKGSEGFIVSVTLNGRSLKQLGLLKLSSWPNWATDGEVLWLVWWPRTWWSLSWAPWSYVEMGLFFSRRDWGTRQNRRKAQCTKILI